VKDDPIVQEVRQIRDAYAAQFDYNLKAIYEDLKAQEQANPKRHHSLPHQRISKALENLR
jgi:hypothetical protein